MQHVTAFILKQQKFSSSCAQWQLKLDLLDEKRKSEDKSLRENIYCKFQVCTDTHSYIKTDSMGLTEKQAYNQNYGNVWLEMAYYS